MSAGTGAWDRLRRKVRWLRSTVSYGYGEGGVSMAQHVSKDINVGRSWGGGEGRGVPGMGSKSRAVRSVQRYTVRQGVQGT